jgi:hypothetical protein
MSGFVHSLEQVKDWEEENPDQIDKVPEKAGDLDAIDVTLWIPAPKARAWPPDVKDNNGATENVQAVQRSQGEINSKVSAVPRHESGEPSDIGGFDFDFGMLFASLVSSMSHLPGSHRVVKRIGLKFERFDVLLGKRGGLPKILL